MTASELISQLQRLPGETTVLVLDENADFCDVGYCTSYQFKDPDVFYQKEEFKFPVVVLLPIDAAPRVKP